MAEVHDWLAKYLAKQDDSFQCIPIISTPGGLTIPMVTSMLPLLPLVWSIHRLKHSGLNQVGVL